MIDPLSQTTARLSISKTEESRLQVKEYLDDSSNVPNRRDSAIYFDDQQPLLQIQQQQVSKRRRRSSNQSINNQQPPQKREKLHKRKLKKQLEPPYIKLNVNLENKNERFPFKNFRDILLRIFNLDQGKKPKWLELNNCEKIEKIVICFCPGIEIDNEEIEQEQQKQEQQKQEQQQQQLSVSKLKKLEQLSFIYDTFEDYIKCSSPGSKDSIHSAFQSIINIPLTKNEKKLIIESSKNDKITIYNLLMNETQLIENNYPMSNDDYQETIDRGEESSKIFALDCEFCKSNNLQVLTRISLLDFNGNIIIDELVKPIEEITDYVTKYSGITEELLKKVETKIEDVQKLFLEKVSKNDILIGHSLESDLIVMKIKHLKIVDTSIIYQHSRGLPFKPSLKWLSKKYLGRCIQNGEDTGHGHSSIEDAKACLDLVKLKIMEGITFGKNLSDVSIFTRFNQKNINIKSMIASYYKEIHEEKNVEKFQVKNDDEIVEKIIETDAKLNFITLKDLEINLNWVKIDQYNGDLDSSSEQAMLRTNKRLDKIYKSLPNNSLFILYSNVKSPKPMYELQNIRRNFQKYEKENYHLNKLTNEQMWDNEKLNQLFKETTKARESIVFYKLKPYTI
ncbi:unnamed protein product [Candida verbasci]|uniref:Exonuclease domain-containing protein n=1 Tax=Candida verbasci TaxID=1227364 RepID=A0A9W4TTC7_9ASCO|nr:unnamed protein product [Candida verbasci]